MHVFQRYTFKSLGLSGQTWWENEFNDIATLTVSLSLTVAGVVHSCEKVQELGPLGWSDVLAHMYDAVHGYVRILLHQATTRKTLKHQKSFNTGWFKVTIEWWCCLPADELQSVFSFQILDVFSDGRRSAILFWHMLLEPLNYCLVIIPEVGLEGKNNPL